MPTRLAIVLTAVASACGGGAPAAPDAAPALPDARPPRAPELTEAPVLSANAAVPLAPRLHFATDVPTRASVAIDDGTRSFELAFDTPSATHDHVLLGLKPGRSHRVIVTVITVDGGTASAAPLSFDTLPLPADFPKITLATSDVSAMEGGVTLFSAFPRGPGVPAGASNYLIAVDEAAEVVWYYGRPDYMGDVRRTSRGTLLYGDREMAVVEIDMAGTTLRRWHAAALHPAPAGAIPVDLDSMHHEAFEMASGNLLLLSSEMRRIRGFPSSETDPNAPPATANVVGDLVAEVRLDGSVVEKWSLLDALDPQRIGYNSLGVFWNVHYADVAAGTRDWSHGNAVVHDPTDDSIVVSLRHQDAVVKLRRTTGSLVWILGPHENWKAPWSAKLLTPVGPMQWQYHQHAARVLSDGHLMLYDNGTFRASPPAAKLDAPQNFSRALELSVDEKAMTVTQVWSYGGPDGEIFYSPFICSADRLPRTGNVLVADGGRIFDDQGLASDDIGGANRFARLVEVTHTTPPRKVWEVIVGDRAPNPVGWLVYRSVRLSSL